MFNAVFHRAIMSHSLTKSGGAIVTCPECSVLMQSHNLDRHIERVHRSKELTNCPNCNATIRRDRLERHLRRVHSVDLKRAHVSTSHIMVAKTAANRTTFEPGNDPAFDRWISEKLGRVLAPPNAKRTFKVRRVGDTDYVLVEFNSTADIEWSVLVWFKKPRVLDERRVAREVNVRFGNAEKRRCSFRDRSAPEAVDYVEGRLTDHGWSVDASESQRNHALLSAIYIHGSLKIRYTLMHLQRLPWAQTLRRAENLEQDLQFVRLEGAFCTDLRRKHDIPDHCSGVITSHLLK